MLPSSFYLYGRHQINAEWIHGWMNEWVGMECGGGGKAIKLDVAKLVEEIDCHTEGLGFVL